MNPAGHMQDRPTRNELFDNLTGRGVLSGTHSARFAFVICAVEIAAVLAIYLICRNRLRALTLNTST